MKATASTRLDALPEEAQRLFIARCVAFSRAFLEHGESFFRDSAMLAAFRRDFGADLQFFSEQLWEVRPQSDDTLALEDRLKLVLDVQDDLPTGVDKLDGHADGAIFIVLAACDWLIGEERASMMARRVTDFLNEVASQEALATAGENVMLADDISASEWVDPEKMRQAQFADCAQSSSVEELKKFARDSAQTLIDLIPKINSVVARSRT